MDVDSSIIQEILTSGGGIAVILSNKELLNKLLGPSADYLGDYNKRFLENILEKQPKNLANIIVKAYKKLGARAEEQGGVEPRIIKAIIEDGVFIEEDVVAEYYSGILASSRSEDGKNDSGLPYLKLLQSMSAFDMMLHSLLYKTVLAEFKELGFQIDNPEDRNKMKIFIPYNELYIQIHKNFRNIDESIIYDKIGDSMFRFSQHAIIKQIWYLANKETIARETKNKVNQTGLIFYPTAIGTSLAMWGYGNGHLSNNLFFQCELNDDLNISHCNNVVRLADGFN